MKIPLTSIFCGLFLIVQAQQVLQLDNFENHPLNNFEGLVQTFKSETTITKETVDGIDAFWNYGSSLRINYDVSSDTASFCGLVSFLPNLDLSTYHYLSFRIKGLVGGEFFHLEMEHQDGTSAKVALWDYLPCGPSLDWQKLIIPLDAFWNLGTPNDVVKLVIVFDYYSAEANGSPLQGSVEVDEFLVGSYFPGCLKLAPFGTGLKTNAVGGNIGEFSQKPNTGNYVSTLRAEGGAVCNSVLKLTYDNGAEDLFGGTFLVLGGGADGWTAQGLDLSMYDELHVDLWAESTATNPGNVKLELKSADTTHVVRVLNIKPEVQSFTIPFSEFSPAIEAGTSISELIIVFERDWQQKLSGTLLVDNIELQSTRSTCADVEKPVPVLFTVNGQTSSEKLIQLEPATVVGIQGDLSNQSEKLESVRIEYFGDCEWHCLAVAYPPFTKESILEFSAALLSSLQYYKMRTVIEYYNGEQHFSPAFTAKVNQENTISGEELFRNAFEVFQLLRAETGVYVDALNLDGPPFHPSSVATTGMGLISLCVADAMGWVENAEELAIETLEAMNGMREGFHPARNCYGWFRHFIDQNTGERVWESEFSSIDSGILTASGLFCKKYFAHNPKIARLADRLYLSINWSSMIAEPESGGIYLTADTLGVGMGVTLPFNEYMIVAWLAKHDQRENKDAELLWKQHYEKTGQLPTSNYGEQILLTDRSGSFLSSFVPQFNHYLCHYFTTQVDYQVFFSNAMRADSLWWRENVAAPCLSWGFGAGSSCQFVSSGYHADDLEDHPGTIASPQTIGGFIPVNPDLIYNLLNLFGKKIGVYELPDANNSKILWRHSLEQPEWQACDLQGIDFATMLLGLAAHPDHLGNDFFKSYNDFTFPTFGDNQIPEMLILNQIELDNCESGRIIYLNPTDSKDVTSELGWHIESIGTSPIILEPLAPNCALFRIAVPCNSVDTCGQFIIELTDTDSNSIRDTVQITYLNGCTITSTHSVESPGIHLFQNYPNPFRNDTRISFQLDPGGPTVLSLFDATGNMIYRKDFGILSSGRHHFQMNDSSNQAFLLPPGLYFYRLQCGSKWVAKHMIRME